MKYLVQGGLSNNNINSEKPSHFSGKLLFESSQCTPKVNIAKLPDAESPLLVTITVST